MSVVDLYTKGARVWLKDEELVWKTGVVTSAFDGSRLSAAADDDPTGDVREVVVKPDKDIPDKEQLPPLRNPEILIGLNDLTSLSYLHEPAVLHNLTVRFIQNEAIYTYCGIVLVAINPYSELQIYGNDTISMYRGKSMGDLDPHVYAVAEEAFTRMERDDLNQSIIVSGESGAGKTVSAKYAMRYFATVGGTSQSETNVEKKVIKSSPIMEAIGNAKTTRNDNSSRFGKYIEIDFNKQFHIIGANMRTYLLEKSRVVFQAPDERNYHIFYQLCSMHDHPDYAFLRLNHPDEFVYLSRGQSPEIDGVDDAKELGATIDAFNMLGFSAKEQKNIFLILAGILHLGNVEFEQGSGRSDSESSAIPSTDASLATMASLLNIEEDQIRKWLCHRKIITARETFVKPMKMADALFARDALAKAIYAKLFDWIVVQINRSLKRKSGKSHKFIGVLDIYGFETFEINSFEQFCINYANEKLQQQFNSHVFKLEQEEYLKEGIEWTMIEFYDNQPCIDLIESKLGVLDLLDEECRMPKGTDQSWVEKLYDKCKKFGHFNKPRLSNSAFIVKHFADMVEYQSQGFLDKNRDTVMEEQMNILKASQNDLLSDLFMETNNNSSDAADVGGSLRAPGRGPPGGAPLPGAGMKTLPAGGGKKSLKKTVGSQFRDSLNLLMATLNQTTPHYIRCVKPNDQKAAFVFDAKRGIQQLRACGVLETVRISAAGFPSRWTYQEFFSRYRVLCHSKDVQRSNYRSTCENIVTKLVSDEDKYKLGKTKIFFRAGQVAYMEKLRSEKLRACGVMIQKHVKMWLYRKRYLQKQKAALTIQRWVRGFLARRLTRTMRRTSAAIKIQKTWRGHTQRSTYLQLRDTTVRLQARARGLMARARHLQLVRNAKSIILQKYIRGWLSRVRYRRSQRQIIMVQCQVRRFIARKQFKKLKIEAKSVEHQKKLNQGLENKIISLQQRLTESEKISKTMKSVQADYANALKTVESLKAENAKNLSFADRVKQLEEEVRELSVQLDKSNCDKIDLINQKQKDLDDYREKEEAQDAEVRSLKKELEVLKEEQAAAADTMSQEATAKMVEENKRLQDECDQERMAYQKLLKGYNRLEVQLENAQDELNAAVNGGAGGQGSTTSLYSSMVHSDYYSESGGNAAGELDESISGRSSVRSTTGGPERGRLDKIDWGKGGGGGNDADIALTVKLQQKLKELQTKNERLERQLNQTASSTPEAGKNTAGDNVKDLEMENTRLRSDLKKLRESMLTPNTSTTEDDDGDIPDQNKVLLEQYEALTDELERRREECIQLRTILANVSSGAGGEGGLADSLGEMPEAEEVYAAYETQKSVIAQMQMQLSDQSSNFKDREGELLEEMEQLKHTCSSQQALIQQAIGKGPANNTEACLQHEISRLTGENFDLREKIEVLQDHKKQLKLMLKTYRKKLAEAGEQVPDLSQAMAAAAAASQANSTSQESTFNSGTSGGGQDHDIMSPAVIKKEHDYLGLFEYNMNHEAEIMRALIYDLKPKIALQMLPGLPSYIMFMMIRYTDHISNESYVRSLIQSAIFYVKKVIKKKGMNDLEVKTLWLSNMIRLLNNLKQYSGEKQFQQDCTTKQIDQCLRNFDLSEFRRVLMDVAVWIYQGVHKLLEEEVQPILVPATLEHEGIGGIGEMTPNPAGGAANKSLPYDSGSAGSNTDPSKQQQINPQEALDRMLRLLTRFHNCFVKHSLDSEVISLIFKQLYFYICAGSLNNLLLRKELCHWSKGMQIRYNIAQLEQWARDQKVHDDKNPVLDSLRPIIQACQLLQARKDDVEEICEMCDQLKVTQIVKILNLYTPADEFEERVTPTFVRKIQAALAERAALENASNQQATLLMDTKFCFAVKFPFHSSSIQLEELDIPDYYNNLHKLLKKV